MTAGKRLVVTADRPPAMLDGVEARLLSRLSGGLVADIEAPEDDLRERIIRQRLAAMPMVEVPDDVVAYLVRHFTRNIRELEGALNKPVSYTHLDVYKRQRLGQDACAPAWAPGSACGGLRGDRAAVGGYRGHGLWCKAGTGVTTKQAWKR